MLLQPTNLHSLIDQLNLDILQPDLHAKIQVCISFRSAGIGRRTQGQTDTRMVSKLYMYIAPTVAAPSKNVSVNLGMGPLAANFNVSKLIHVRSRFVPSRSLMPVTLFTVSMGALLVPKLVRHATIHCIEY